MNPGNFNLMTLVCDYHTTMDAIDAVVLTHDKWEGVDSDLKNAMARFIRQARLMVAGLRRGRDGDMELGAIHELLRDAFGPLGNPDT